MKYDANNKLEDQEGWDELSRKEQILIGTNRMFDEMEEEDRCKEYHLSTEQGVGCPHCDYKDTYLVQCHKLIYKVCDECKIVYLCKDACETFTDPDIEKFADDNPDKTIEDYKTMKYDWMNKKFADYALEDHPEIS